MAGYFPFPFFPLLASALYCQSSSNAYTDNRIVKNIENAYLQNRETIILGDFNVNDRYLDQQS